MPSSLDAGGIGNDVGELLMWAVLSPREIQITVEGDAMPIVAPMDVVRRDSVLRPAAIEVKLAMP